MYHENLPSSGTGKTKTATKLAEETDSSNGGTIIMYQHCTNGWVDMGINLVTEDREDSY